MRALLKRDTRGQLMLVTGIILAIGLLSLTIISVNVSNVGHQVARPQRSIANEIDTIDSVLDSSLNVVANNLFKSSALDQRVCISQAFDSICEDIIVHEARYGFAFQATLISVSDYSNPYSVEITFTLSDGETDFTLIQKYLVTFEY